MIIAQRTKLLEVHAIPIKATLGSVLVVFLSYSCSGWRNSIKYGIKIRRTYISFQSPTYWQHLRLFMAKHDFPALPGLYSLIFMYAEPGQYLKVKSFIVFDCSLASSIFPAIFVWIYPGGSWFHDQLVPLPSSPSFSGEMSLATSMAVWQLVNCMFFFRFLDRWSSLA